MFVTNDTVEIHAFNTASEEKVTILLLSGEEGDKPQGRQRSRTLDEVDRQKQKQRMQQYFQQQNQNELSDYLKMR